jgi:hypothetical protein
MAASGREVRELGSSRRIAATARVTFLLACLGLVTFWWLNLI